jgi:hypothetical protein
VQLAQRQPDGDTLRGYLQWHASASGIADPRLSARVPDGCEWLWSTYCELAAMRPAGIGMSPIPGHEYESWQRLNSIELSAWEIDTLRAMDRAAMHAAAEAQAQQSQKGKA